MSCDLLCMLVLKELFLINSTSNRQKTYTLAFHNAWIVLKLSATAASFKICHILTSLVSLIPAGIWNMTNRKNLSWWCIKKRIFSISLETSFYLSPPHLAASIASFKLLFALVFLQFLSELHLHACFFPVALSVVIVSPPVHNSSQQATLPFGLAAVYAGTTGHKTKHAFLRLKYIRRKKKCFILGYWWDACLLSFLSLFARSQAYACEHWAYPEWLLQLVGNKILYIYGHLQKRITPIFSYFMSFPYTNSSCFPFDRKKEQILFSVHILMFKCKNKNVRRVGKCGNFHKTVQQSQQLCQFVVPRTCLGNLSSWLYLIPVLIEPVRTCK